MGVGWSGRVSVGGKLDVETWEGDVLVRPSGKRERTENEKPWKREL